MFISATTMQFMRTVYDSCSSQGWCVREVCYSDPPPLCTIEHPVPKWFNLPLWEMEKLCSETSILSVRALRKVSKRLTCGHRE